MVWDEASNELSLYVDGQLAGLVQSMGDHSSNNNALLMGAWTSNSEYFDGLIDEVRISDFVRYSSGFTPSTAPFGVDSGTVALWHLDEGEGQAIADASGNSWDGVLGSTTATESSDPAWSVDSPD
jgi:hypothetical protein